MSGPAWTRDVACGHRALETTGGKTWEAAHVLAEFLEDAWPQLDLRPGARVLELGSGTGWLGMTLARNAPQLSEVLLTEQAGGGAMEWLVHNLEKNRAAGLPLDSARAAELDWSRWHGREAPAPEGPWDLVLGSDLIYTSDLAVLLPRVLRAFLLGEGAGPRRGVLYAHTLHRFDFMDVDFFAEVRSLGLDYRLVAWPEAEGESPPGDPLEGDGILEELFPDKRVAVFQVLPADAPEELWLLPARALQRGQAEAAAPAAAALAATGGDDCATEEEAEASEDQGRVWIEGGICLVLDDEASSGADGACPDCLTLRLPVQGPFGSGRHPTTRLMLAHLASGEGRARLPGAAVCDYGCGSGVLGLAALALGAASAAGVDVEPTSLAAAAENAAANGARPSTAPAKAASGGPGNLAVAAAGGTAAAPGEGAAPCAGRALELYLPPADTLERDLDFFCRYGDWRDAKATRGWPLLPAGAGFDLVLANIVVGPLCSVAPVVRSLLAARAGSSGGEVLLAGMRGEGQELQVREAYGAQGFELESLGALGDWRLLRGRLPAA